MSTGQAVAVVRLVLDVAGTDETDAQPDLDRLNALLGDLDLPGARATIRELGLLVAGVLRALSTRNLDVEEFLTGWGLALALEAP